MKSCRVCIFCALVSASSAQTYFNAWLTSCTHLIGPTGNVKTLQLALEQSRGQAAGSPAFAWDMWVDVGDWTASQHPPTHEDGEHLSAFLNTSLGAQRGLFFTVAGNHDGEAKGWQPGEFALKYINPLGATEFAATSGSAPHSGRKTNSFASFYHTRAHGGIVIWSARATSSGSCSATAMNTTRSRKRAATSRVSFKRAAAVRRACLKVAIPRAR